MIMSFSPSVIPWLQANQISLQIVFPLSNNEIETLEHLQATNVKSLRLMVDRLTPNENYQRLESFSSIESITVINADNRHFYMKVLQRFLVYSFMGFLL